MGSWGGEARSVCAWVWMERRAKRRVEVRRVVRRLVRAVRGGEGGRKGRGMGGWRRRVRVEVRVLSRVSRWAVLRVRLERGGVRKGDFLGGGKGVTHRFKWAMWVFMREMEKRRKNLRR